MHNKPRNRLEKNMSAFDEEDSKTVRSLALTMAGLAILTVSLIVLASFLI